MWIKNRAKSCLSLGVLLICLLVNSNSSKALNQRGEKNVLRIGAYADFGIINPIFNTSGAAADIDEVIFNRLINVDEKGNIVLELAEKWDISADGKIHTLKLREDVRFHDGVHLTAEDAKFTYELVKSPIYRSPLHYEAIDIQAIELLDPWTIRIFLKEAHPRFLRILTRGILPKHLYESGDPISNSSNYAPIGSGPFVFKEWKVEEGEVWLEANANYWDKPPLVPTRSSMT